ERALSARWPAASAADCARSAIDLISAICSVVAQPPARAAIARASPVALSTVLFMSSSPVVRMAETPQFEAMHDERFHRHWQTQTGRRRRRRETQVAVLAG